MQFFAVCLDKPDHGLARKANRDAHLTYLSEQGTKILGAGPILADDSETVIGSLLLIEADNTQGARALLEGDPYAKACLFMSVQMRPWRWVVNPITPGVME